MKSKFLSLLSAAGILVLGVNVSSAANHYVRSGAAGANNGTSWTDAFTDIPATLVRGDTYFLAGGSYGSHSFSTAASGSTYVYIKKANAADNSSDPGWNPAYASTQAVFNGSPTFHVAMPYLSIDGVTGSGQSGYGIALITTGTTEPGGACIWFNGTSPNYFILKHVECSAPAPNGNLSNFVIDSQMWPGPTGTLYQNCYVHGGLVSVRFTGSNETLDHCYLYNCGGQGHAEMICDANAQNLTVRYSVLRDLLSGATTYIEPQVNGGQVPNGLYVYGNVFYGTAANEGCQNPAMLSMTSGEIIQNCYIYNNTIYGLHDAAGGYQDTGVGASSAGNNSVNVVVRNNLWQACTYGPGFAGVSTQDHNLLNTGGASFVNPSAGDFHLTANTSPGVNLGSPYNLDPDGNVRTTWSMGAYEYGSSTNPVIAISSSSLAFGSVLVGSSSNLTLTGTEPGRGHARGHGFRQRPI